MPLATTLPAAILETILTRLAALFLTGAAGDLTAARHAATIIGFSFQSLEALGQAAAPDLLITRILRLRSCAVSLSRESQKAERRLEQLQKARRQGIPEHPANAQP